MTVNIKYNIIIYNTSQVPFNVFKDFFSAGKIPILQSNYLFSYFFWSLKNFYFFIVVQISLKNLLRGRVYR